MKHPKAASLLLLLTLMLAPSLVPSARAMCDLIPPRQNLLASDLGRVSRAVAVQIDGAKHADDEVRIRLTPCEDSPGFSSTPANNVVQVIFLPVCEGGGCIEQPVTVDTADVSVPAETCADPDRCPELRFVIRDTRSLFPPYGLAGPARIEVRRSDVAGNPIAARIEDLSLPSNGCDSVREEIFEKFTVLPVANDFAALVANATGELLATVDGGGNLLIPLHYASVLPDGVGAPIARLLSGSSNIDAHSDQPGMPLSIPSSDYVRSFTADGRPLPPLLRVDSTHRTLIGTADGDTGIIRIARQLDGAPLDGIYEFRDRLAGGNGPIVIPASGGGVTARAGARIPLRSLRADGQAVAFIRDEQIEAVDLNADGDQEDRIVQIFDPETNALPTDTLAPVVEVRSKDASIQALVAAGPLVAFLESEAFQRPIGSPIAGDLNGDGDTLDSILRVYRVETDGTASDVTSALEERDLTADAAPILNDRAAVLSAGMVFFRTPEAGRVPQVTELVSVDGDGNPVGVGGVPDFGSLSDDGRFVLWHGDPLPADPPENTWAAAIHDRQQSLPSPPEIVSLDIDQRRCADGDPSGLSADGRFVAFIGWCPLLEGGAPFAGIPGIYVRDRQAATTQRLTHGTNGAPANGSSRGTISAGGRFVAVVTQATNLVPGLPDGNGTKPDVILYDRENGAVDLVSQAADGSAADGNYIGDASVSADGRFVLFVSDSGNLTAEEVAPGQFDVFLRDRCVSNGTFLPTCTPRTELVSSCAPGIRANDVSASARMTRDARFVMFTSRADNLLSGDCSSRGDTNALPDVFLRDRCESMGVPIAGCIPGIERISVDSLGREANDESLSGGLADEGRLVTFSSAATNLVLGGAPVLSGSYVHDRATGVTEPLVNEFSGPDLIENYALISEDGLVTAIVDRATPFIQTYVRGPDPSATGYDLDGDGDARDVVLRVLDTASGEFRTAAQVAASKLAVTGGRALLVTPASSGDEAMLYDGNTDPLDPGAQPGSRVSSLGRQAREIALSHQLIALTVPSSPGDLLEVRPIDGATFIATGLVANEIAATGNTVVLATPEGLTPCISGFPCRRARADLNRDGDSEDRVLRVYHHDASSPRVANVGQGIEDFVVDVGPIDEEIEDSNPRFPHLVAFRTREADEGCASGPGCVDRARDLNGDGDTSDFVMNVYDLTTDTLVPTGQAAIPCTLPGCEPGVIYKVKGNSVSFLTREADQGGTDLNGNGRSSDIVVQVFNVQSRTAQVFDFTTETRENGATQVTPPPPLLEDFLDAPILYTTVDECDLGPDVDYDRDGQCDVVTLVVGDQDRDGTLNESKTAADTCVEKPDAEQLDSDLDGIGDACDDHDYCSTFTPPAPEPVPANAKACQSTVSRAALAYFRQRVAAQRACFQAIARGTLQGSADALCRGRFGASGEILPADPKTARRILKAGAALRRSLARSCDAAERAALDTCARPDGAPTLDSLDECLRRTYGESANAVSQLAYGALTPIQGRTGQACQKALGLASSSYLTTVMSTLGSCLLQFDPAGSESTQAACLGSSDEIAGVTAAAATSSELIAAQARMKKQIVDGCGADGLLQVKDCGDACEATCTGTPDVVAECRAQCAIDCMTCSGWRQAVENLRSAFGPNRP